MPPLPPSVPPAVGVCRIAATGEGGGYTITQQIAISDPPYTQDADGENGFVNSSAREITGFEGGQVDDYALFLYMPDAGGAPVLRIVITQIGDDADGDYYEANLSGVAGCASIVYNRLGRIVGVYDNNGDWYGAPHEDGWHTKPATTTVYDLGP